MAKPTPPSANPIDALLEERARFQTWLTRLDSAGSDAPPVVRAKIRGDYQQRLDQVIEQLRGHDIDIARRTVAKYREMLRIPSSSKRRKVF